MYNYNCDKRKSTFKINVKEQAKQLRESVTSQKLNNLN